MAAVKRFNKLLGLEEIDVLIYYRREPNGMV